MQLAQLFKCLTDDTRLTCTLLIYQCQQLCVGELVEATGQSQPKISRHLAQLRACGLLTDERKEQWVYYSLHPDLPPWALAILATAAETDQTKLETMLNKLNGFTCGPGQC